VGDISADSSIPFSIPLSQPNLLKPGINSVTLKVVYADDLKNFHEVVLDSHVNFEQKQNSANPERARQGSSFGSLPSLFIPIVGMGVVVVAVVVIRKQRNSKSLKLANNQNNFENEINSLLDEHENKNNKK
jgi:hypothetical protein